MGQVPKLKQVTVVTAGTRVSLLSSGDGFDQSNIVSCAIQPTNNIVYVGDNTVSASSSKGTRLASPDMTLTIGGSGKDAIDLAKIYLDSTVDGTIVNVLFMVRV